jgi:hypothetical protein
VPILRATKKEEVRVEYNVTESGDNAVVLGSHTIIENTNIGGTGHV